MPRDRHGGKTSAESSAANRKRQQTGKKAPKSRVQAAAAAATGSRNRKKPLTGDYHVTAVLEPLNSPSTATPFS